MTPAERWVSDGPALAVKLMRAIGRVVGGEPPPASDSQRLLDMAAAVKDAILVTLDVCGDCGGPADIGDAERVNCECGNVVCSRCCEAFEGESYCCACACELLRGQVEMIVRWLRGSHISERHDDAEEIADAIDAGEPMAWCESPEGKAMEAP